MYELQVDYNSNEIWTTIDKDKDLGALIKQAKKFGISWQIVEVLTKVTYINTDN